LKKKARQEVIPPQLLLTAGTDFILFGEQQDQQQDKNLHIIIKIQMRIAIINRPTPT
jgi:hypothetical protein